ncbi:unknown [Bacteroides sp. CAG:709]|nr:unknown [Bacteroides sp. CAG:709]
MPRYCRSKFYLFICGAWPPPLLLFFSDIIAILAIMYALAHLMNGRYENCNCR